MQRKTDIFNRQINQVLKANYPKRDMMIVSYDTPKILQDIGPENLPITITRKHFYTITNKYGKYDNVNYHDISIDLIKQIPYALENPIAILKSNTKSDSVVIVTNLFNNKLNNIIASIKINGRGQINDVQFDTNVLTSVYGKSSNYNNFIKKHKEKENLLYEINVGIINKIKNR